MTVLTLVMFSALTTGASLQAPFHPSVTQSASAPEMRVDINQATIEELLKVPGMTRTWASRIIRFRPYRTKQDLLDEGVVSGEVYSRIKDCIIAHREKQ
jgi:DNA uptake protein ComE-like DNA-binding protein